MPTKEENKKRYPAYWKLLSYAIRYFRAAGRCEWIDDTGRCERIDGDPIPGNPRGSKTVLTVAHLNHTPEDCRMENLAAYCQMHHLRYDAKEHAKNAKETRRQKVTALYEDTLF